MKKSVDNMADRKSSLGAMNHQEPRVSPPVDSSPLTMDKNRESLKVKLLVRRSANQLVEQGILPPLKTSPAIHEQKKNLERAKTGDLLKAKIQQRPNRQELERRHILEAHESHIDPSLADKYRMLEKAILYDQLNKKILHRPGPLELIEKNILHANEPIERIVKEGLVPFKVSGEEDQIEQNFLSFEDDSQSSEGDLFQHSVQIQNEMYKEAPTEAGSSSQEKHVFESLPTSSGVINISLVPTNNLLSSTSAPISVATFKIHNSSVEPMTIPPPPPPPKLELITYHVKPMLQPHANGLINTQNFLPIQIADTQISNVLAPALMPSQAPTAVNQHISSFIQNNQKFSAPGKEKNRKKCKNKAASKARAIKFHEYKGPSHKNSSVPSPSSLLASSANAENNKKVGETNYELIMQQQCLLEYLEGIYKNPHAASVKQESESQKFACKPIKVEKVFDLSNDERDKCAVSNEKLKTFNKPHVTIFPSKPPSQSPPSISLETPKDLNITDVSKLSKMKVSELKAYLKRVNLPVSGPKPLLIERLKPYLPFKPLEDNNTDDSSNMMSEGNDFYNTSLHSVSSAESDMESVDTKPGIACATVKDEDIMAEQQRKIEELQRKLKQSLDEMEMLRQNKSSDIPALQPPQQKIIIDPQYSMQSHVATVFVVEAPTAVCNSDESNVIASTAENEVQNRSKHDSSSEPEARENTPEASLVQNTSTMLSQDKVNLMSLPQVKGANTATSNVIPMSQDITDVLEILLKNGEWPEMSDEDKNLSNAFIQNLSENTPLPSDSVLSAKHFIEDVLSARNPFDVMSPMNEDSILEVDGGLDKILDSVTPSNGDSAVLHGNFSSGYSHENNLEFPMDIEDDSCLPINSTDFNRNLFQASDYVEKPHLTMQSYKQTHFDGMKNENCDSHFVNSAKNSHQVTAENTIVNSNFPDELQKSPTSCTKNGLIGNFDNNLFDALKSSNINNNSCNDLFLTSTAAKHMKEDNKGLISNLHLPSNYDIFSTGLDNTAMDFESIIPYNDLQSDSMFQIAGFDSGLGHDENYGFNDHRGIFSDESRMSNGDGMTCEVDNLLCNL